MSTISLEGTNLNAPPATQNSRNKLGQDDFLTLMITQFRNQDPFEPMDNGEFLGQLAQFSTVSGIDSLNSGFAGLSASLQNEQALQAASLVGHSVLAATDIGYLADGANIDGAVQLDASANDVQIDIVDASGQLIQRLGLGQQQAGKVEFRWDGRSADGELAEPGHYQVRVRVLRGANVESAQTFIESKISSVTLGRGGQGMTLNLLGGNSLPLGSVYEII